MPCRHDTSDAASELAGFIARHPDTAWLDALVIDLAGTLRGKRYPREDGTFVPVNASWGYNNRSVAVRVPAGENASRRIAATGVCA